MGIDPIVLRKRVEAAYEKSGNQLGWRLLTSPISVTVKAEIAFLGLNPAGRSRPPDHPEFSTAEGSAYVTERWNEKNLPGESRLQRQVRALFQHLQVLPEEVLAGNLVPFRSPSWDLLESRRSSLEFGEQLWADILCHAKPRLVIGMGRETFDSLSRILSAGNAKKIAIGWGNVSGIRASFDDGLLVGIPHLSRFGIMTRNSSESGLRELFGDHWKS